MWMRKFNQTKTWLLHPLLLTSTGFSPRWGLQWPAGFTIFRSVCLVGGFHKWGFRKDGWFIRDDDWGCQQEMDDDWGYPYLRKPPYIGNFIIPTDHIFQRAKNHQSDCQCGRKNVSATKILDHLGISSSIYRSRDGAERTHCGSWVFYAVKMGCNLLKTQVHCNNVYSWPFPELCA